MMRGRIPVVCAFVAALVGGGGGAVRSAAPQSDAGLYWPADRSLPKFAAAEHFDVADISSLSDEQKTLFATLEGLVNRTKPRIFLLQGAPEGKTAWLDGFGVPQTAVDDPWQLIARYRDEIKGIVVNDPAVPASLNVATTLAGLDDGVVASPSLAQRLQSEDQLAVLEDLRGRFKDDLDAQTWAVQNLWPRTNHRLIVGITTREAGGFRDYPVATRAMAIWLRAGVPAERALWERMLRNMPPDSPYVGWFDRDQPSSEIPGVWFLTEHGMYDVAGNIFHNLTAFGGVPADALSAPQAAPPPEPLRPKIYVTLTVSDGDNLQYMQHRMRVLWADPARGSVPLNWTVNPIAVDCAPPLLGYYRKTATADDYLIAGPSGAGYAMVSTFPAVAYDKFAARTGEYFAETGIAVSQVHNLLRGGAQPIPAAKAAALAVGARPLGVMTFVKDRPPGVSVLAGGLVVATQVYAWSVADAERKIAAAAASWDGRSPRFVAVYLDAWHMGPTDAAAIANSLGASDEVVRADRFFQFARQANGLPPR